LINWIVYSAPAHPNQGSLLNDVASSSTLRNSDVEGLSAVASQTGVTLAGGNIDADPGFANSYGFIDADGPDDRWASFDDGLAPDLSSPVVDAGTVLVLPTTPDEDIRGVPRPGLTLQPNPGQPSKSSPWDNPQIDMGAYEATRLRHMEWDDIVQRLAEDVHDRDDTTRPEREFRLCDDRFESSNSDSNAMSFVFREVPVDDQRDRGRIVDDAIRKLTKRMTHNESTVPFDIAMLGDEFDDLTSFLRSIELFK